MARLMLAAAILLYSGEETYSITVTVSNMR